MLKYLFFALCLLLVVLCIHALIDCARTPSERIQHVPRVIWLLFMLFAPVLGALAWTYLGKRPVERGARGL